MAEGSDGLWQELSALADEYAELGRGMLQAARRLQSPGMLPAESLVDQIVKLRLTTESIRRRTCELARALGVPIPEVRSLDNLKGLAEFLEVVAEAEDRAAVRSAKVRDAAELLDRVLQLQHVTDPTFAPLAECQNQARQLREQILSLALAAEMDDTLVGLLERDHPFAYLMMLVDGVEVVSDDLWESLFDAVGRAFGRPLAAAVARAKIVLDPVSEQRSEAAARPDTSTPEPKRSTDAEAPAEASPAASTVIETPSTVGEMLTLEVVFEPVKVETAPRPAPTALTDEAANAIIDSAVEESFSFLPKGLSSLLSARRNIRAARKRSAPRVERLEKLRLLSCNTISGFVFLDANNDGIYQSGEQPVVGNPIELRNASDVLVGTSVTDAQGFYSFSTDQTIDTTPKTVDQTITIASQPTNFTVPYSIAKFDPELGELIGVEISVSGTLSSDIKAENMSGSSGDTIVGTVAGTITLTGPGVHVTSSLSAPAGSFNASKFDGVVDFAGTSGTDFGVQTAPINQTISLVKGADDLTPFIGTGTLPGTFEAKATSGAQGGGNLDARSDSTANATVRVVYRYIPSNCLAEGQYTIVQTQQPPGTLDGKRSSDGVVYPPPAIGPDRLTVTLGDSDLTHNDFGELLPSSLSGAVYYDQNDNGVQDPGESGIPGTTITLAGSDDLGAVNRTLVTDGLGGYDFTNLRPGIYQIDEAQPPGYLDGKESIGTQGGTVGFDRFYGISLPQGVAGTDYDFGELKAAGLAGQVFWDKNNDGLIQPGEPGIAGVTVGLKGVDSLGNVVDRVVATDSNGAYAFLNLVPGTYELNETQPSGYLDGIDTVGTQGGSTAPDRFYGINLGPDATGLNYNFGEIKPSSLSGYVYVDGNDNGIKDASEAGIPGVPVALRGTDDLGAGVNLTTLTDATGAYQFTGLRPGSYQIDESQPPAYLDGKDSVGTQGGSLGNDSISNIPLPQDVHGINNNFGELPPAEINGFVYVDLNRNGVKDPGEPGLPNVAIALSGVDDQGASVAQSVVTNAQGFYDFTRLRPGTYAVTEPTQPAGYSDGQESRNNTLIVPNSTATDSITGIVLTPGAIDADDNFGEYQGGTPSDNDCDELTVPEGVDRLGIHHQPTRFVIHFSKELDPASAENLANYHLVMVSRDGKVSRREIPLKSAVYNETAKTVTLTPAIPLNIHYHYRLTVSGLIDDCGNPVDGNRDGIAGGDFVTVVTKANYPHPTPAAPHVTRTSSWAQRFPRLAAARDSLLGSRIGAAGTSRQSGRRNP
ncbi:MAG: SdrD B-like domain-containing protein [Isosphaeraceae bacterium]